MENTTTITEAQKPTLDDSMTLPQILETATRGYLDSLDGMDALPEPLGIASGLINYITANLSLYNAAVDKNMRLPVPRVLSHDQIASLILKLRNVAMVSLLHNKNGSTNTKSSEYDVLAVYQTEGPGKGTYSTKEAVIREVIREFYPQAQKRDFDNIMLCLSDKAPHKSQCRDKDLVAVNNGIFNYKTKQLMPFTPDKVFLSKSPVDYVKGASNPVLYNPEDCTYWDVESWMQEICGSPEKTNLMWQIIGAVIRPCVPWDKAALLYAKEGNNGKGTLCALMRNLCGPENCADISLRAFGKDFMLTALIGASAVIVDENNVGAFLNETEELKAFITGDTIMINRKNKNAVAYQCQCFMVQCVNEVPKVKDKSDSFYRRLLCIPFEKCFTGAERRYIKHDYIARKKVLEYVLHRVLHMKDYYELDEPAECKALMSEFKEENNPVITFWDEFRDQFVWDLLPFSFLYDLYKAWYMKNYPGPGSSLLGSRTFSNELRKVTASDDIWEMSTSSAISTGNKMDATEKLIAEYDLKEWKTLTNSASLTRCCTIPFSKRKKEYKGLYRKIPTTACSGD